MGTFITGPDPLPAPKTDAPGRSASGLSYELDAGDFNAVWGALADVRTAIAAVGSNGFTMPKLAKLTMDGTVGKATVGAGGLGELYFYADPNAGDSNFLFNFDTAGPSTSDIFSFGKNFSQQFRLDAGGTLTIIPSGSAAVEILTGKLLSWSSGAAIRDSASNASIILQTPVADSGVNTAFTLRTIATLTGARSLLDIYNAAAKAWAFGPAAMTFPDGTTQSTAASGGGGGGTVGTAVNTPSTGVARDSGGAFATTSISLEGGSGVQALGLTSGAKINLDTANGSSGSYILDSYGAIELRARYGLVLSGGGTLSISTPYQMEFGHERTNALFIDGGTTGQPVTLTANGYASDANVGISLIAKGTGVVKIAGTGGIKFYDGTVQTTAAGGGGGGISAMAAVGSAPNANGAAISGATLTLEPASATLPGVLTAGAQTIGGSKTFASFVGVNGDTGSSTFPLDVNGPIIANNVANYAAYGLTMSNGVDATWTVIPAATGQARMKTDSAGRWMSIADGAGTTDVFAIRNGRTLIGSTTDNGTDALQVTGKATVSSKLGIGIANPGEPLDVYGAPTADGALSAILLLANNATSHSSNPSSGIDFGVNISIGAVNGVAGIAGGKENGTPGNTAGFLAFYSQADAGAKVEQGRFDSSGRFVTKSGKMRNRTPHTVDYAALVTDDIIAYTTLAASRTVTLPSPDGLNRGQEYVVQDETGNAAAGNSITIATTGGSVFGANTITTAYGGRTVYSNGVNWYAR